MVHHAFADRNGNPHVFNLNSNDDGLWLNDNWTNPDNEWNSDNQFVFRVPKVFLFRALKGAVFLLWICQTFLPSAQHFAGLVELIR